MRKILIATAMAGIVIAGAAYAQTPSQNPAGGPPQGRWGQYSAEDRAAFADGRIASFKTMLRLTPEQERLWPPVEAALREAVRERIARWGAMRQMRDSDAGGIDRLRAMSDRMSEAAASMRKIADAAQPLYAALDANQKRRIDRILSRGGRGMGMGMGMGMGPGGGQGGGYGGHGGHGGEWRRGGEGYGPGGGWGQGRGPGWGGGGGPGWGQGGPGWGGGGGGPGWGQGGPGWGGGGGPGWGQGGPGWGGGWGPRE